MKNIKKGITYINKLKNWKNKGHIHKNDIIISCNFLFIKLFYYETSTTTSINMEALE